MTQFRERTNQKLGYAEIHFEELKNYQNAMSNDDWENAHQESYFYQLSSAVEGLLHEINSGYSLNLRLNQVKWEKVKSSLKSTNQSSPAFNLIDSLRNDRQSWLSQLFEWRNHGIHRSRVGKMVHVSTWQIVDNEFKDPRTNKSQTVYPNSGCQDVLVKLKDDVKNLIEHCRNIDTKL